MRASGWDVIPLIRMTNINLEPGDSSLERMIGETDDGVYMSTNQSWSIDDKRVNFQFGCEIAWEIRKGKRRRMYRNPNYAGKTVEFWSSCDAVGSRDEWDVYGTPNCGKGQPGQTARVAHGTAVARIAPPDPDFPGLAPPEPLSAPDRCDDATALTTPQERAAAVAAALAEFPEGIEGAGYVDTVADEVLVCSTTGLRMFGRTSRA